MPKTYLNPVYDQYMADPFVLHDGDHYYAYGTTRPMPEGKQFRVLESSDLVTWKLHGGALIPMGHAEYWAPEVAVCNGIYYLYYSSGGVGGLNHQLYVATSCTPWGRSRTAGEF